MDGFDHGLTHPLSTVLRRLTVFLVSVSLAVCSISPARAEEPMLEFAQGLRDRGYYDTAIEYLDGLVSRTDLSPEVRDIWKPNPKPFPTLLPPTP